MKSAKQLVTIIVFGALACIGLQAQSINVRATIPFDFIAGKTPMPAGHYQISTNGAVVRVSRLDGKPTDVFVMTISPVVEEYGLAHRLQFNRYGDDYFLASIWNARMPEAALEKEAARRLGTPIEASVLASKK